jgi:hypothetical protein
MSVVMIVPEYSGPPASCSLEIIGSSESEEQAAANNSNKGAKIRKVRRLNAREIVPSLLPGLSIYLFLKLFWKYKTYLLARRIGSGRR